MEQARNDHNQFVVDLLATLREQRFSTAAWWRFLACSWRMSSATAQANPGLKRSWQRVTFLMLLLATALMVAVIAFEGFMAAWHLLPGLLFCVVWQQSDLYWHLGLNRHVQTGALLPKIGLANLLTTWRGLAASFLLSRLIGGLLTPAWLALVVLLTGIITDILDGQVARRTNTQSKLGQIMDAETDFCLYLAITVILLQQHMLAPWLAIIMLLRFCLPLLAVLASYFLLAQPVPFSSTRWGKYAGLAQCSYFLVLLAPPQFTAFTHAITLPLLIITVILLIVAPLAQIVPHMRHAR